MTTNRNSGVGLRERKKALTRRVIQEAAFHLFATSGYAATSVEQIIAAADVSESTFYRYFAVKSDLLFSDAVLPALAAGVAAQPAGLPPVAAVRSALGEAFAGHPASSRRAERDRWRTILAEPELRARLAASLTGTVDTLAAAFDARAGTTATENARTIAACVIGVCLDVLLAAGQPEAADFDAAAVLDDALHRLETVLSAEGRDG